MNEQFGPIQGISRGGLIDLLQLFAGDLPIQLDTTVNELDQRNEKVEVAFSDGSSRHFDLVVGADGMHSETRQMLLDESEYAYRDTGWGGWMFWADSSLAPWDTFTEYWAGRFVGLYRGRVERAQTSSRKLGRMMFLRSKLFCTVRNQLLRFYSVERLVKDIASIMEEPI